MTFVVNEVTREIQSSVVSRVKLRCLIELMTFAVSKLLEAELGSEVRIDLIEGVSLFSRLKIADFLNGLVEGVFLFSGAELVADSPLITLLNEVTQGADDGELAIGFNEGFSAK